MRSYNCDDHKKFMYALCARDIRRLAAMVDRANLDADIRVEMDSALEQLEARLFLFAFADDATGTLVGDVDRYSDGRPVTTTIDWAARSPRSFIAPIRTMRRAGRQRNWPRSSGLLAQMTPAATRSKSTARTMRDNAVPHTYPDELLDFDIVRRQTVTT